MIKRGIRPSQELFLVLLIVLLAAFLVAFEMETHGLEAAKPTSATAVTPAAWDPLQGPPAPATIVTVQSPLPSRPDPDEPWLRPISAADGAFFETGSAQIPPADPNKPNEISMQTRLMGLAREIDERSRGLKMDGVEIIGHADTKRILRVPADIKTASYGFYSGVGLDVMMSVHCRCVTKPPVGSGPENLLALDMAEDDWKKVIPSNVDLAMMRALTVIRFLKDLKLQRIAREEGEGHLLESMEEFLPLSGGSFIKTDGRFDDTLIEIDDKQRRRIEARLFRVRDRHVDPKSMPAAGNSIPQK